MNSVVQTKPLKERHFFCGLHLFSPLCSVPHGQKQWKKNFSVLRCLISATTGYTHTHKHTHTHGKDHHTFELHTSSPVQCCGRKAHAHTRMHVQTDTHTPGEG